MPVEASWVLIGLGFFAGLMFGTMMGDRDNPNAPKPSSNELDKRWHDGFRAGEKSMARRMTVRLKDEEIYLAMKEDYHG